MADTVHLVQLVRGNERRLALVAEPDLICLTEVEATYDLAQRCLAAAKPMAAEAESLATAERLSYDEIYSGNSDWHLLPPIDMPGHPTRVLLAGTGLTHLGSARERQAMHLADQAKHPDAPFVQEQPVATDSMRMFQWGVEQGRPAEGHIGIAPEWFFKGDATMLRAPFEPIEIPFHAEDGGEEAELAGVYLIAPDGTPHRIGFTQANEFSDHAFEKRNYLNLAGSKLRACSIGPELVLTADFIDIPGEVSITRQDATLWHKRIATGEANMCHSLANLEHHHFKFVGHRQPGAVHVHFFGADALSFGAGISLKQGDIAKVHFEGFGRPLVNPITVEPPANHPVGVRSLA